MNFNATTQKSIAMMLLLGLTGCNDKSGKATEANPKDDKAKGNDKPVVDVTPTPSPVAETAPTLPKELESVFQAQKELQQENAPINEPESAVIIQLKDMPKQFVEKLDSILMNSRTGVLKTEAVNGAVVETFAINTAEALRQLTKEQVFDYARLERDANFSVEGNQEVVVKDPSKLAEMVTDAAKILLMDTALSGKVYENDYDRVEAHYIDTNDNLDGKFVQNGNKSGFHGDHVLNTLLLNTNYGGFLSKNGKIYFVGSSSGNLRLYSQLMSNQFEQGLKDGYNIVSGSWVWYTDPKKDKNLSFEKWFNQEEKHQGYSFAQEATDRLAGYAEKYDMLLINGTGNEASADRVSYLPYYLMSEQERYQKLLNSTIFVTSWDLDKQGKPNYASPCDVVMHYCLSANDVTKYSIVVNKTARSITYNGYTARGTSIATPYVASVAGLVKSVYPFMSNENLATTLLTTATDVGEAGIDPVYGWGVVNPTDAVNGPRQFFNQDFVVDLGLGQDFASQNQIYKFSNDIGGKHGLTVSGENNAKKTSLSLSGYNTYEGKTVINKGGILNVDGVLTNSDIEVNQGGYLMGSGLVQAVNNKGAVYAHSIFQNNDEARGQNSLIIDGNYKQDKSATLFAELGNPLKVTGNAELDGALVVNGVKKAYNTIGTSNVFGDVMHVLGEIAGAFTNVSITQPLLSLDKVEYDTVTLADGTQLSKATVYTKYLGLTDNLSQIVGTDQPVFQAVAEVSKAVDELNNKVSSRVEANANTLDTKKVNGSTVSVETQENATGAQSFLANLQNETDLAKVKSTLLSLSGYDFGEVAQQNDGLAKAVNYTKLLKSSEQQEGFGASYHHNVSSIGKVNTIGVNYGANGYQANVSLAKGNLNYDNVLSQANVKTQYHNVNVAVSKALANDLNVMGAVNVDTFNSTLADKTLKQRDLGATLSLSKGVKLTHNQSLEMLAGYNVTQSRLTGVNGNVGINYGYKTQSLINHYAHAGLSYKASNLFDVNGLNVKAHAIYVQKLNKDKKLAGYLQDEAVSVDVSMPTTSNKNAMMAGIELSQKWKNVEIGVSYQHVKAKNADNQIGANIKITF